MTSQLPWFPFNASAFSSSRRVRRLTDLQFRVYLLALCEMWQRGALEDDPEEWRVLGFDPDAIEHLKKVGLLQVGPKGLVNPRLEGCRREADERAETARRNGRKGGRPRKERDESVASEPNGNPVGLRPVPRATPAINTDRAPSDPEP